MLIRADGCCVFFFSSRRRHTRYIGDWSSDVCSSDLPVRAHHEKKLEQKLIGVGEARIGDVPQMAVTILATDLAELTRPIRQNTGKTGVRQTSVGGPGAAVEAATDGPAAVDAVFSR